MSRLTTKLQTNTVRTFRDTPSSQSSKTTNIQEDDTRKLAGYQSIRLWLHLEPGTATNAIFLPVNEREDDVYCLYWFLYCPLGETHFKIINVAPSGECSRYHCRMRLSSALLINNETVESVLQRLDDIRYTDCFPSGKVNVHCPIIIAVV